MDHVSLILLRVTNHIYMYPQVMERTRRQTVIRAVSHHENVNSGSLPGVAFLVGLYIVKGACAEHQGWRVLWASWG